MPKLNFFNWLFEPKAKKEMPFLEFFRLASEQFPSDSISVVIERWRHFPTPIESPIRFSIWSHLMECHCTGDTPEEAVQDYANKMDAFLAQEKESTSADQ